MYKPLCGLQKYKIFILNYSLEAIKPITDFYSDKESQYFSECCTSFPVSKIKEVFAGNQLYCQNTSSAIQYRVAFHLPRNQLAINQ